MKKTSIFATIAFACLFATSCTDNMDEPVLESNENREYHGVPLEEALQHLNGVLTAMEEPTRSSATRRIESVKVVRSKDFVTRSIASGVANADSLIYVVNFEDNQGFAYLAADDRISTPVIYVADGGAAPMSSITPIIRTRPIYEGYPLNGPGIFTDNDVAPGQLFMNPNTFNFYDSSVNDSYSGDFFINGEADYLEMISRVNDLVINHIDKEIGNDNGSIYQEIEYEDDPDPEHGSGSNHVEIRKTITITKDTIVHNILTFAKDWSQWAPFNNYCPSVKEYIIGGEERNAPVGCVPLAIAKIMTHHGHPASYAVNGTAINWTLVKNFASTIAKNQTGLLLRNIGDMCLSLYFYEGTFTFPSLAASYLANRGYTGVYYTDYNHNIVLQMLNNNCPVFVCSVPTNGLLCSLDKSHGWNIDGYLIHTTTTRKDYYEFDVIIDTETTTSNKIMVHCDFGWSGYCNGYFTSGVFDLYGDHNDVDFDVNEHYQTYDVNYNAYLKIIRYNRP